MSDLNVPIGQDGKPQFFLALHNMLAKEKIYYTVESNVQDEKANENWVATIRVKGVDYTAGPTKQKQAAKDAAAEKALRALGWL